MDIVAVVLMADYLALTMVELSIDMMDMNWVGWKVFSMAGD